MTELAPTDREPIPIRIEVGDAAVHLADETVRREVRDRVAGYVAGMLQDLGIAGSPDVTVNAAIGTSADDPYLRTGIRGVWCRQALRPRPPLPASAREAARQIQWDLWRNRLLLLTPESSKRIQDLWIAEDVGPVTALDPATFHELLSALLARGLDVRRARALRSEELLPSNPAQVWRTVETVIDDRTATRALVWMGRAVWDALDADAIAPGDSESFDDLLRSVAGSVHRKTGVLTVPPTAAGDGRLDDREVCFQLNDLRTPASDGLCCDEWLVFTGVDDLARAGIVATTFRHPITGAACSRVPGDGHMLAQCRALGETVGAGGVTGFALREFMCAEAANLLTVASVECLLDMLRGTDAVLVDAAADRFDPTVLTWTLRDLVADLVSVRDLRGILEALMSIEGSRASARTAGALTPDAVVYWADWVRGELRRQISSRYLGAASVMAIWLVSPDLETRLASLEADPLSGEERDRLFASLLRSYDQDAASPFVIVTTPQGRRPLRALIRHELPAGTVLSFQDLSPDTIIKPLGRIGGP